MAANGGEGPGGDVPALSRRFLEELIFSFDGSRRFTQDSPVLPDVWLYYGCERPLGPLDLLLTPHRGTRAGALVRRLRGGRLNAYRDEHPQRHWIGGERAPHRIAYTHANVAARLYFDELVRVVLPMTAWWRNAVIGAEGKEADEPRPIAAMIERLKAHREPLSEALAAVLRLARERARGRRSEPPPQGLTPPDVRPELFWMAGVIGAVAWTAGCAARAPGDGAAGGRARVAIREDEGCEVALDPRTGEPLTPREWADEVVAALVELLGGAFEYPRPQRTGDEGGEAAAEPPDEELPPAEELERVYLINRNRPAGTAVNDSGPAIKADAARLLFNVDCSRLTWAVIDSGIDAAHRAFHVRTAEHVPVPLDGRNAKFEFESRVLKTYDFTRLRALLDPERLLLDSGECAVPTHVKKAIEKGEAEGASSRDRKRAERLTRNLATLYDLLDQGRDLDWSLYEDLLEMPHDDDYEKPSAAFDHGTHVAGILAADWWEEDRKQKGAWRIEMQGICPDLRLYDLRVLGPPGDEDDGDLATRGGEEFIVIAALQFVRYLNESRDYVVVHGANLSLSINHDIANYACGRTPVCEECERLVDAGVVVVAAAGNQGYLRYQTHQGFKEGYHTISITDPGNAQSVITVGATHRDRPHTYGVSYFSSRGPTGDGRAKPDLVAPGEKVTAPLPGGSSGRKDGTSMAAPHVSGAAALLMARYDELIGEPLRVKELICSTATDLGRERYFQGAGMLDVLRAMQAQ